MSHDTEQFIEQPDTSHDIEPNGSVGEALPAEPDQSSHAAEQGTHDPDGGIAAALAAVEEARATNGQTVDETSSGQDTIGHTIQPVSPQEVADRHVLSTDHKEDHLSWLAGEAKEVLDVGSQVLNMFRHRSGR